MLQLVQEWSFLETPSLKVFPFPTADMQGLEQGKQPKPMGGSLTLSPVMKQGEQVGCCCSICPMSAHTLRPFARDCAGNPICCLQSRGIRHLNSPRSSTALAAALSWYKVHSVKFSPYIKNVLGVSELLPLLRDGEKTQLSAPTPSIVV